MTDHPNDSNHVLHEANDAAPVVQDKDFFSFPYDPYDIQLDLMRQLWQTLEQKHIGIYESPTGTGKSMSLICGALTWLTKNTDEYGLLRQQKPTNNQETTTDKAAEPSWLAEFTQASHEKQAKAQQTKAREALQSIETIRKEADSVRKKRRFVHAYNHQEHHRKKRPIASSTKAIGDPGEEEAKHLVDDYDSDAAKLADSSDSESEATATSRHYRPDDRPDYGVLKIIYCSRTHSQISQFIREIKRTAFADRLRVVALGSRKNLCIHPTVTKLRSDLQMNDKCLSMLQSKTSKTKCPYYDRTLFEHFKDHALAHVQDIEDLHQLGYDMSVCSYYGSRVSLPLAQVVTMPYSMLLSKDARDSLGIDVRNQIVIVDEAHNLIDAINNTYKVEISNKQLVVARRSLWSYFRKYEKRFKGKNCFYIKQLLSITELLATYLKQLGKECSRLQPEDEDMAPTGKMFTITDFLFAVHMDHFNLFKILQYLTQSELAKKLMGFMDMETNVPVQSTPETIKNDDSAYESKHASPIRQIEALLKALTTASADGRLLVQPHHPSKGMEGQIKFLLLNPSIPFQEIATEARSVILAGGTMQPVSDVIRQLFPSIPSTSIDLFSCGHVIPPTNLMGFTLSTGPTQKHFEFTFANRHNVDAIDELGRVLINLARVVPGGIVTFFPSYRFEANVIQRWQATNQLAELEQKKSVFREPKAADELDQVLSDYSAACQSANGAMLFSVVGGKMSEGINFSDELARCVVMVGMPYPNARDPELVEKMKYLNAQDPGTGQELYENLCMKAVNQSIGRSIRHQKDYACILLIDHRYSYERTQKRLPEWIQQRMEPTGSRFGPMYSSLVRFFRTKASIE